MISPDVTEPPFVSVIIPVYNDTERLRLCLQALSRQTWPHSALEVLVVDNNSQENVAAVVKDFAFAKQLFEAVPGSYAARNAGIAAAKGALLAFTDADCLPSESWLEQAWLAIKSAPLRADHRCIAVGGPVQLFAKSEQAPTWAETYELTTGFDQRKYIEEQHYTVTANCVATREAFDATGVFDSKLRSAGDKDWGQRAYAHGVSLVYAPGAVVRHPARHDLEQLVAKRRRQTGGKWRALQARKPRWAATAQTLLQVTRPPVERVAKALRRAPEKSAVGPLMTAVRVFCVSSALSLACSVEVVRLHLGKTEER